MTNTTRTIKAAAILMTTMGTILTAAPAFADNYQDDVQNCRAAMMTQSNIDINDYRLRFERSEGRRTRTVYLKAIPVKGGDAFRFTCSINRTGVIALNHSGSTIKLAWSK